VIAFSSSRIIRACVLGFLAGVTTGCYVYTPVASPPVPGQQLLLDLNDQGRVGLGPSIGSASSQVEGVVQPGTDSAYRLKIVAVSYLNGQRNKWSGEPLVVSRGFVRDVKLRQFSKSRSALTVAAVVGGALLFIVTRSILGGGAPGSGNEGGGGGGNGS
jgi:hypothetical protein